MTMATVNIQNIQRLVEQLTPAEQLELVEKLARDLRKRGDWPAKLSADSVGNGDLDALAHASVKLAPDTLSVEDFSDWKM